MSNKKPMVLVLAGPNGSGKSTISQYFEKVGEYTMQMMWLLQREWIMPRLPDLLIRKDMLQFLKKGILHLKLCYLQNISSEY